MEYRIENKASHIYWIQRIILAVENMNYFLSEKGHC
jgi:hypothetical protein